MEVSVFIVSAGNVVGGDRFEHERNKPALDERDVRRDGTGGGELLDPGDQHDLRGQRPVRHARYGTPV